MARDIIRTPNAPATASSSSHPSISLPGCAHGDTSNDFRSSIENSLRYAEWALAELRHDPNADMSSVTSLGHGGGGLQALLLGMRDPRITAVANIDAAIFSSRTDPAQLLFYNPRLMRVPCLYLLTADTCRQSDQYSGFEKMNFSRRYEVQ